MIPELKTKKSYEELQVNKTNMLCLDRITVRFVQTGLLSKRRVLILPVYWYKKREGDLQVQGLLYSIYHNPNPLFVLEFNEGAFETFH